jgi:raffinose/stachyose/melibiose transport system permease protein
LKTKQIFLNFCKYAFLVLFAGIFIFPIVVILINSFKQKFIISTSPFSFPTKETFAGFENYIKGVSDIGFFNAFFYSVFITVFSVLAILLFTSMTAWYIIRYKNRFTNFLYKALIFSMLVPFQMVMFTLSKTANVLRLDTPVGLIFVYLGFGAGLSVFLFCGFVKSLPKSIEEAAFIDGCSATQTFFKVVLPLLKPTAVSVAILQTMWIFNDYLLPYLLIGNEYKTLPVAVAYLKGGYGSVDMGAMMAVLVLCVIPVVVFYLFCQKYIIKGIAAGAVKG